MSTFEQILNYAKATLDDLDDRLVTVEADLAVARSDVDRWREVADGLAAEVAEGAAAVASLQAALSASQVLVAELTATRDALQRRIDELTATTTTTTTPKPTTTTTTTLKPTTTTTTTAAPPAEVPSPGLWFKLPDNIRQSPIKVFDHKFGPYPRSLDNAATRDQTYYARHYLNPQGESGKFADIGGLLRNMPVFRPPISGDYLLEDAKFDIRSAAAGGHDGFLCDIMGESGATWDRYQKQIQAAVALKDEVPGFLIVPMLDTNGDLAKNYASGARTAAQVAAKLVTYAGKPCSWMIDGRFVISSFKAEGLSASRWQAILDELGKLGHPAVFWSVALNFNLSAGLASATIGEGSWGYSADPKLIRNSSNQTANSASRGKKFMFPVTSQNIRANGGWYDESLNLEGHRASWEKAIAEQPAAIQHVTGDDYSEGAESLVSEARGYCVLDIDAWYVTRLKTGSFPKILRDAAFLSHRSNPVNSTPTGPQTKFMRQWIGSGRPSSGQSAPRDMVEAMVFLTAPARVRITTADGMVEVPAPAGQSVHLAPLAVGAPPKVEVLRDGVVVAQVTSVVPVKARTVVDDKQYYVFSSLRGTAGQRASATL